MFKHYNSDLIKRDEDRIFSQELWNISHQYLLGDEFKGFEINYRSLHSKLVNLSEENDDNGITFSLHAHLWGGVFPILKFGNKEKVGPCLTDLLSGRSVASLVYTDCKKDPLVCTKGGDGKFLLSGKKKYITNAPIANLFIVYAKTDDHKMNAFILNKNHKGMSIGENLKLTGLRTSTIANIDFDNCIVEKGDLLGQEGNGSLIFNGCIEKERLFIMSSILGRLLKLKSQYQKMAKQNNLLEFYPNLETLTFIQGAITTTTGLLNESIKLLENGESIFLSSAQAKVIITSLYQEVCRKIIQSLGAKGLEQANGFERENRDAIASSIYSGSNEMLNKLIASCSKH